MKDKEIKELLDTIVILVDTREKANSHIIKSFDKYDINWEKYKLDFGDYSVKLPKNDKYNIKEDIYFNTKIAIERKNSLNELGNNISTNRDRFKREFEKAKDSKLILMIEDDTYKNIINKTYKNKLEPNSYLAMLHSLSISYDLPFIFIDRDVAFIFIYYVLKYYIRDYLKNI
ncbi:ERCC4 domain-containing protein [Clostridium sporogenes]